MTTITELEVLLGACSPAPWRTGSMCNGAIQLDRGTDQPLAIAPPIDAVTIAPLRNAAPDMIAAVRLLREARDSVNATGNHHFSDCRESYTDECPCCVMVKRIDAVLAKVGA